MDNYKGKGHGSSESNFPRMEESIKKGMTEEGRQGKEGRGREKVNGENVKTGGKKSKRTNTQTSTMVIPG